MLLTSDTDPNDIDDALPTMTLARKMHGGARVRRLLLMLDTCYSGQGGSELTTYALTRMTRQWNDSPASGSEGPGFVIITSAQPHQAARTGALPQLLHAAVTGLPTADGAR